MSKPGGVPVVIGTALSGVVFGLLRCKPRDGFFHERIFLEHQLSYHAEVITCHEKKDKGKEPSQRKSQQKKRSMYDTKQKTYIRGTKQKTAMRVGQP